MPEIFYKIFLLKNDVIFHYKNNRNDTFFSNNQSSKNSGGRLRNHAKISYPIVTYKDCLDLQDAKFNSELTFLPSQEENYKISI